MEEKKRYGYRIVVSPGEATMIGFSIPNPPRPKKGDGIEVFLEFLAEQVGAESTALYVTAAAGGSATRELRARLENIIKQLDLASPGSNLEIKLVLGDLLASNEKKQAD